MDRSKTDPSWPSGYPAIVRQNFCGGGEYISVQVNDEVQVSSKEDQYGNVCVQYPQEPTGNPGTTGWVSAKVLEIGKTRRIGEALEVEIGDPYCPPLDSSIQSSGDLFYRTAFTLLKSYDTHRDALPAVPVYIHKVLGTDAQVQNFTETLVNSVHKVSSSLLLLLDNIGFFDIRDIRDSSFDAQNTTLSGVYVILYSDFPNDPLRTDIYVGSTSDFQGRYQTHVRERNKPNPRGMHYSSAAKARKHGIFPICILDVVDGYQLKLAEQVFLGLFQSTCGTVLTYQVRDFLNTNEEYQPTNGLSSAELLGRASKYLIDKDEAIVLMSLAVQVFNLTGWPGCVRGESRGKLFGAQRGLNWSMPLTEVQYVRTTWTRTEMQGRVLNFRRPAGIVRGDDGSDVVLWKERTDGRQFTFYLPKRVEGPSIGTKVHVVFEIRIDGVSHPSHWSRAATVGVFKDFHDATTIALRIEWQDEDGRWLWRYIKQELWYNRQVEGAPTGTTTGYAVATAMRAFFLRQRHKPTEQFPWIIDFGVAAVKEVYIDHLSQTIRTRALQGVTTSPPKELVTYHEIGRKLILLGATTYAKPFELSYPALPQGLILDDDEFIVARDNACDHCRAQQIAAKNKTLRCEKVHKENQCVECKKLGRPCTFTPDRILFDKTASELLLASLNPPQDETPPKLVDYWFFHQF